MSEAEKWEEISKLLEAQIKAMKKASAICFKIECEYEKVKEILNRGS